jgi:hypothetical protein
MIFKNTNFAAHFDGRFHAVKVTHAWPQWTVHVDNVLVFEKRVLWKWAYPQELFRFQNDGHEYVVSLKGWTGWAQWLELRVDGQEAGRVSGGANDGPVAAATSGAKTEVPQDGSEPRSELVETKRIEQPLGDGAAPAPAPAPVAAAPPPIANIPEQIKKLAELRDMGVLTVDEFEAKKKELLSRM